jgi:hypothetical protein
MNRLVPSSLYLFNHFEKWVTIALCQDHNVKQAVGGSAIFPIPERLSQARTNRGSAVGWCEKEYKEYQVESGLWLTIIPFLHIIIYNVRHVSTIDI